METELNSGIRNDTIFLGYVFGMTKPEFGKKTKELRNIGKLYINELNTLEYKMTISDDLFGKDLETTFSPEFHNKKLFKLGISVRPNLTTNTQLTQLQLVSLFNDKYGFYNHSENSIIDGYKNYFWIDGNRQIEVLAGFDDARVYYTDLIAERERKEKEKTDQKKEIENSKNDL